MGLHTSKFEEETGEEIPGLKFIGRDQLSPEVTQGVSDAHEKKAKARERGLKAAATRKANKERREREQAEKGAATPESGPIFGDAVPKGPAGSIAPPLLDVTPHLLDVTPEEDEAFNAITEAQEYANEIIEALDEEEADPSGLSASTPGAKLDAGKIDIAMILALFPRALFGIGSVGVFGAEKYSLGGFLEVKDGVHRYTAAGVRHMLKNFISEDLDDDSLMEHKCHKAWNAMAELELFMRDKGLTGEFKVGG